MTNFAEAKGLIFLGIVYASMCDEMHVEMACSPRLPAVLARDVLYGVSVYTIRHFRLGPPYTTILELSVLTGQSAVAPNWLTSVVRNQKYNSKSLVIALVEYGL